MIGRLLGHSEVQTTKRYAHLASDWLKESAVRISESIAADILTGYSGLDTETVGEARGWAIEDNHATVTPPFSARLRARTPQVA